MKVICENADKCEKKTCAQTGFTNHSTPHDHNEDDCVGKCGFLEGILGSKCVPYVEKTEIEKDFPNMSKTETVPVSDLASEMIKANDKRKKPHRVDLIKDQAMLELGKSKERVKWLESELVRVKEKSEKDMEEAIREIEKRNGSYFRWMVAAWLAMFWAASYLSKLWK